MVTYNVKTAAAMLGRSQTFVFTKGQLLNVSPPYTPKDLQRISPINAAATMAMITGTDVETVNNAKRQLRLKIRTDFEKIMEGVMLYKTGEYTWKGVRKRLGIEELV